MRIKKALRIVYRKSICIIKAFNRNTYNKVFFRYLRYVGVDIQDSPYFISDDVYIDDVDPKKIKIEKNVTISRGVTLLVHDFSVSYPLKQRDTSVIGGVLIKPIILREGCFIGTNVTILPGTEVGANSIIGACSVIKGKIADNTVVAGNPGKVVKTMDEYREKVISEELPYIKIWMKGFM